MSSHEVTKKEPTRHSPASECELTEYEESNPHAATRARVLGRLQFKIGGEACAVPLNMVQSGNYRGLSVVGATASIGGSAGLFAQCCWFEDDIDWFWVEITSILKIEKREDPRFRGGTPCLWLITHVAEYALATCHVDFNAEWEDTLQMFDVPRCDTWPRLGVRPDWWPDEWTKEWPYDRSLREYRLAVITEYSLASLAGSMSLTSPSIPPEWRRTNPGSQVGLDRPMHNLGQTSDWVIQPDAGQRLPQFDEKKAKECQAGGQVQPHHGDARKRKRTGNKKDRQPAESSASTFKRQR
ncbi:hypothetical protein RhiJN_02578 [Ceratobasidium sp. AG-Ba]|nr:hypothetical protein RhiJN_02578 [Ceratobasidium sp. AG-Ba]